MAFLVDFLAVGMLVASCCGDAKKAGDVEVAASASGVSLFGPAVGQVGVSAGIFESASWWAK